MKKGNVNQVLAIIISYTVILVFAIEFGKYKVVENRESGANSICYGTELLTDIDGDGSDEKITVKDNRSGDMAFTQISAYLDSGDIIFKDYSDYWTSYIVSGDLTGDKVSDIVLMRIATGSTYGGGSFSVLHLKDGNWEEYPHSFVHNINLDIEQPEEFEQLTCVGVSIVKTDKGNLLRIVSIDSIVDDTVRCIDCSYRSNGWYIENIEIVTEYYEKDKEKNILKLDL